MIQNRAVRNDPRMLGRRSESVLQQMDQEFLKMKEDRDKAFERATEQWQADRARITEQEKQYKSDVQTYPQRLDEATKRQMELVRRQRFGPAADEIDKTTIASAAKVEPMTQTLRMIPELNGMVDKMFSGQFAGDKLAVMKTLNAADKALLGPFFGNRGYFNDEIQATEAFKSAISSIVATTLKGISGSSGITEGERAYAEKAAAGDISMEPESIKRVLGIIQRAGINNIRDHNDRMDKVYDDPKRNDVAMHRMYKVDLPPEAFDPTDIMNLQATPNSPEERARFDRIYGNGSARRITGFGR